MTLLEPTDSAMNRVRNEVGVHYSLCIMHYALCVEQVLGEWSSTRA
jgi:hypothetical protein